MEFGLGSAVEFTAVEVLVVIERAENGVEEFAHGGDQGLHFGFAARLEVLVVSTHLLR